MSDIEQYVRAVMSQPDRNSRREALERTPAHKRAQVEAEVRYRWRKKRKK